MKETDQETVQEKTVEPPAPEKTTAKRYSEEDKQAAIADLEAGMKQQEVADKYGVSVNSLNAWKKKLKKSDKNTKIPEGNTPKNVTNQNVVEDTLIRLALQNSEIRKKIVDLVVKETK